MIFWLPLFCIEATLTVPKYSQILLVPATYKRKKKNVLLSAIQTVFGAAVWVWKI
jgi:hypothetical protein